LPWPGKAQNKQSGGSLDPLTIVQQERPAAPKKKDSRVAVLEPLTKALQALPSAQS